MSKSLPENQTHITITEAAKILGVTKRTLQRWVKSGKLHAIRPSGKECYFTVEEIEKHMQNDLLSVEEAAKLLGVTIEEFLEFGSKGLITRIANDNGQFGYTKESVEQLLHTLFYMQQKAKHDQAVLMQEAAKNDPTKLEEFLKQESAADQPVEQKVMGTVVSQDTHYLHRLRIFHRILLLTGLAVSLFVAMIVFVITLFFLIVPDETAAFFGYKQSSALQQATNKKVLGAHIGADATQEEHLLGTILKPFSSVALAIVKQIDEKKHKRIVPEKKITDVNDVLTVDSQGNIVPRANFKLPDSSYLVTSDGELVEKLKAEIREYALALIEKRETIIIEKESAPIVSATSIENTSLSILPGQITSTELAVGAVTSATLANGAVTIAKLDGGISLLGDNTVSSAFIKNGEVKDEDIADGAVTDSKLAQITTSEKVAGSAVQLSVSGGLANNGGLTLLQTCTDGQVLTWNALSAGWECNSIAGGGGDITAVTAGTGLTGGGTTGALTLHAVLGDSVDLATEVSGVLPAANGGTGATTLNDLITLGTHTSGNYVGTITGGSGISIGGSAGEAWAPSIALGALTGDWNQNAAFDIVLGHASSEVRLLESAGSTYYGTFDVGDLAADQVYTFGIGGTVYTSGNDPFDTSGEIQAVTTGGDVSGALSNIQIGASAVGTTEAAGLDISDDTNLNASDGITLTGDSLTNTDKGSSQNIFKNLAVSGQSTVLSDANSDTLTLIGGSNVTITTDASTDTITISAATGGTYSAGNDLDLTGSTFDLESVIDTVSTINLAGTGTLNGLDVIDATSESTIESAIDTLSNLTAASGLVSVGTLTSGGTGAGFTLNFGTSTLSGNITGSNIDESTLSGLGASNFTSAGVSQWTNDAGYISDGNTNWNNSYGFITASSTDTLTNKSGNISQWTNDSSYISDGNTGWDNSYGFITDGNSSWDNSYGFITASSTDTLTNKSGNISMWTNDSGYLSSVDISANTNLSASDGITLTGDALTNSDKGSSQNIFKTIAVSGQNNVVSDANTDTLTLVAGTNVTITTNDATDAITINAADTNTTYSAGNDLDLTGTTFDLESTLDIVSTINLAGTGTLNGLDVIDATSESTIESAIDTLANLTSASSLATVGTLTGGSTGAGFTLNFGTSTLSGNITGLNIDESTLAGLSTSNFTSAAISQWTNDSGYITDGNTNWNNSYGLITASSTDTLTNKSGNISQWTNDSGYLTTVDVSGNTNLSAGNGVTLTGDALSLDATYTPTWTGLHTFTRAGEQILLKPASAPGANTKLLDAQATGVGTTVFSIDYEGDVVANSLSLATGLTDANVSDALTISSAGSVDVAALSGTVGDANVANDLTISGGTVNNSIIGGTSAAAGTFTDLTANGNAVLGDGTGNDSVTIRKNGSGNVTFTGYASCTALETDGSGNLTCGSDDTGGGAGSLDVSYDNGGTISVDNGDVLFNLADATNDYKFTINNSTNGAIATGLAFTTSVASGTFGTAIDVSDADIATALALGSNDVTVGGVTLSSSELALLDSKTTLVDTDDAVATAITGTGTLTSGSTGAGFTLNFGTSTLSGNIGGGNIDESSLAGLGTSNFTSAAISQWTNDSGYITDGNTGWDNSYNFITASSSDALSNKTGNISMWTNDSGYLTSVSNGNLGNDTIDLTKVADSLTFDNTLTLVSDNSTNDYKLVLDNASTGDIAELFQVTTTGVGGTVGTALNLSDVDIATALALGSNDVTVGGVTIDSTEFARLNGVNAALVDADDAVATAITGTGTLTAGSTGAGFTLNFGTSTLSGDITGANISSLDISSDTNLSASDGISLTGDALTNSDKGSSQNIFKTYAVSGQSDVVTDTNADTITFAAGSNVTLTTNAGTDTITIAATDTNTTYSAGNDLDLTATTFALETTLDFVDTINLAGTGTLNGLDVIDATSESTIENAIDTLSNLTSASSLATVGTLTGGSTGAGFTLNFGTSTLSGNIGGGNIDESSLAGLGTSNFTSAAISQWTNDSGYITDGNTNWNNSYGFITASSSDALSNKTGNISMWTNDSGYLTSVSNGNLGNDTIDLTKVADSLTLDNSLTFVSDNSTNDYKVVFDNASTGDIATLLQITTTGVGGTIATALDLSDADIATGLALGSNDVTVNGVTISAAEFGLLDGGVALSELTDSGTLTAGTVDINGGAIDGTAIGANSRSTGAFTTLSANSTITLGDGTGTDNITLDDGAGNITFTGYTSCTALETNGSGQLTCGTDDTGGGGGITTIQSNDVDAVTSAVTIDFVGSDFDVSANGAEGDIAIDYTNSGITRKNQSETIQNDWTFSFAEGEDLAINLAVSGTNAGSGETITLTNSSSSGNQYGLVIDNAASTGTTDALLVLDNSDADTAVTAAIQIINAGGGFTNLFDVAGTGISVAEFTILDSGLALSELTDSGTLTATTVDINGGNIDGTTIGGTTRAAASVTDLNSNGLSTLGDGTGADNITFNRGSGTITFTGFNSCSALETNGSGQLVCGTDDTGGGGGGSSNWTQTNGVLRPNNNTADVLIGGDATGSAKFAFMNLNSNSGQDPLASFSGNLRLGARPNATTGLIKLTQTEPGQIASGGTTLIASVSASAVYNGSLYVGTGRGALGGAEVYRYDGSSTNWTRVSHSVPGTITSGGTADISSVSAMTVFNGKLYVGTFKTAQAEVYQYEGGTTWSRVSQTAAGTFRATTAVDGVTSMAVSGGKLYIGTAKTAGAQVFRYENNFGWVAMNTTAGRFDATQKNVYAVTAMASYFNTLYIGTQRGATAEVYRMIGPQTATAFTLVSTATGTVCTTLNAGAGSAGVQAIRAMTVYAGNLYIGTENQANGGEVCRYDAAIGAAGTISTTWTRVTSAAGTIRAGGTTGIRAVWSLSVYNGKLFAGTEKVNAAELYEYTDGNDWIVKNTTAGTLASTANIDKVTTLIPYNDYLYVGTGENNPTAANGAEVYTYKNIMDQSYALKFQAASSDVPVNGGAVNEASIYYLASASANLSSANGSTGAFVFSHGIQTRNGSYDVAEDYPTRDDTLTAGDVVSIDVNEGGYVKKSEGAYDYTVIGVFSENPALRLSQLDPSIDGARTIPVALAGRVPVKVSTENGEIKPGDFLTASSQPGVAMKATKSGVVFGQAMSGFSGEGVGKVTVYIKSTTYQGEVAATVASFEIDTQAASEDILSSILTQAVSEPSSVLTTDRLVAGFDVIAPKIVADEIFAKTIKADRIEGLEIYTDKLASLEEAVLSLQSVGASASAVITNGSEAIPAKIDDEDGIASSQASRNDEVTLESLFIDGVATISGQLTSDKVRVKDSLLVEAMANIVDTLMTARLIVNDVATFFGKVVFKDDVKIDGKLTVGKDTAGIAIVKKGTDQVEITFDKAYEEKPIITISLNVDDDEAALEELLLHSDIKYIITRRSKTGFIIKLNKQATQDIRFSWTAVEGRTAEAGSESVATNEQQFVTPTIVITTTPSVPEVLTPTP